MPQPHDVDRMFAFLRANLRARAVISSLRRWQAIENRTLNEVGQIVERAPNPFVRVILEIVRHDSLVHHRVQQCLIDSLTHSEPMSATEVLTRSVAELADDESPHREALRLADELVPLVRSPLHQALLDYLIEDVRKHQRLLAWLRELPRSNSPESRAVEPPI